MCSCYYFDTIHVEWVFATVGMRSGIVCRFYPFLAFQIHTFICVCGYRFNVVLYWPQMSVKETGIFTARKRSCGRVMFLHLSVSLSVHGGCLALGLGCVVMGPEGVPLGLGVYTPWSHTPLVTPLWSHTPPGLRPRTQTPTHTHYGQKAGGTHPTGMLSC